MERDRKEKKNPLAAIQEDYLRGKGKGAVNERTCQDYYAKPLFHFFLLEFLE